MNKKINFEQLDKKFIDVTAVEINTKDDIIIKYNVINPFQRIMIEYEFEVEDGEESGGFSLMYRKSLNNKVTIIENDDKYPRKFNNPKNFIITKTRNFPIN